MSTTENTDVLVDALKALWAGDLTQRMPESGEMAEIARQHNEFLDRMRTFHSDHERITREVGVEDRFGVQAEKGGLQGAWKEMNDRLNDMSARITDQIRNISAVTHAVATGDLSKKITVEARGETLELKNMINLMVDKLNAFAYEVTRLLREITTDGILGGQASISSGAHPTCCSRSR